MNRFQTLVSNSSCAATPREASPEPLAELYPEKRIAVYWITLRGDDDYDDAEGGNGAGEKR
jgi:hypothetical protein